jgi:dipeptidyl aminopeptidase/acylaminoacyl peptidase
MPFTVDELVRLRRVGSVAASPDGTWLAVSVARLDGKQSRYVSDLWRVSLTDPAAPPVQLTWGDKSDHGPAFRRDGALAFLSTRSPRAGEPEPGDDKRDQVWLLPAGGGEPVPLTDEPLGVLDFRFARSGDRLVVVAPVLPDVPHDQQRARAREIAEQGPSALRFTELPARHWDHWLEPAAPHLIAYDERGGGRRDLTPKADREHRSFEFDLEWDLSADGKRVAAQSQRMGADRVPESSIRVIDTATGAAVDLGADPLVTHGAPRLSPDGRRVATTRHRRDPGRCGKPVLWIYDAGGGAGRALAADWDVWPSVAAWTGDGAALVATADHGGHVPIFRVDAAGGEVTRISAEAAGGSHGGLALSGSTLVGTRHRLQHPPEPFRCALAAGATPELLGGGLSGFSEADGRAVARWESVSVPGDGGAPVQTFMIAPAAARGRGPALLLIHGGPIGAFADGWHWRWNPLVFADAGYTLALANPRGSTGFGQDFVEGIWNNAWGGACYRDLMAVADALAARPEVDPARVGAAGGSFGGYMANWIGATTDRFRCLVSHAGLYDLSAFHGVTDYPAWFSIEMGIHPWQDTETFERYSPHRGLGKWKTPTLIIHGERDFRVPIGEALALFEGLRAHQVPAELLVFPDENHWILKPRNIAAWYRGFIGFADRWLRA